MNSNLFFIFLQFYIYVYQGVLLNLSQQIFCNSIYNNYGLSINHLARLRGEGGS